MGKVYKNPNQPVYSTQNFEPIPHFHPPANNQIKIPQGYVIPMDQFDAVLAKAEQDIAGNNLNDALQHLMNLEVTDFNHIHTHELLADVFLKINEIELAKEQCRICAQLIEKEIPNDIFTLKTFEELVSNAGSIEQAEEEFKTVMSSEINNSNFHTGTKTALNLATLKISEKKYQEAEKLLILYRDRYLRFLENNTN